MRLITTHIHSDFDGLAAMVAAQKLYPDAVLAFPGSQERNVRDYINQNLAYRYDFQKAKSIDATAVTTLILVDTRSSERIGPFAQCLENPDLQLHIFDHHLQNPGDLEGDMEVIADVGSTTTLIVELLKEKQVELTADEATTLALGIYEDTGSLTHLTTTPEDLRAAAWLVEKGAKLDTVAQFITHEMTTSQLSALHELIKHAQQYTIQDIGVVVACHSSDHYIDDFSLIARRFMAMENLNVLFCLVSMAGRLYLIARSRLSEVNVGNIARDFGGGGHATAASATIRDITLIEAQEKLIHSLHRHINPVAIASEMMAKPAITVTPDTTITQAKALLTRYNITAVPVRLDTRITSDGGHGIVGIITRQIIEKAAHHNLGNNPVSDYMSSEVRTLGLNATLADIQELIIENRQRIIPIVQNSALVGVITRTDLLNRLVNDPSHLPRNLMHESDLPSLERKRNVSQQMVDCLDKEMIQLLQTIGEVAHGLRWNAFAVGGFVRDLLLKKRNLDLDVVVEGDGIEFARHLSERLGGRYRTHERFKTAMVLLPSQFKIDIATARLEYYEYPAAMPTVELSSIKLDLSRRDFTINAMAIQLNPNLFGTLIDFFNCQNDLKQKTIKVLHNLSFVEDPSRIFRAIRFEQRMGFLISPHTRRLIQNAVSMGLFGKTTDSRFFSEMKIIFSEENPLPALQRLAEFELYQFLWPEQDPSIYTDRRFTHILNQTRQAVSWYRLLYLQEGFQAWMVYLLAIMHHSTTSQIAAFCQRFEELPKNIQYLLEQKELADQAGHELARSNDHLNSEIVGILEDLRIEGLLYLMAVTRKNHVRRAVSLFVTSLRQVEPELSGKDLMAMGYQPGPKFKQMLNQLRNGRLDGTLRSRADEEQYLLDTYPH